MFDHFFSRTASSSGASGPEKHSENLVRLPTVSIPSFSGGAAEWTSFFAIFKSLVIENTAISNVERFHYLHSSIKGEASELIKGLDITAEYFKIALQLLQERYENKRKAATIHAEKLMSLSTNQFPSAKNIRTLISTYREHVEALRVLVVLPANLEGTADGFFLFLIMVKKLDPTTRCNFERGLESNKDIPGPDTLIAFLEKECAALEASNDSTKNLRRPEIGRLTTTHMSQTNRCLVCKQTDHAVCQCNAFLRQSVEQRRGFEQKNRLCFNCLRPHRAQNCSSETRCRHCKGKHHSLIHWSKFNQGQLGKDDASTSDASQTKPEQSKDTEVRATSCTASLSPTGKHVLLSTVLVNVLNGQGNYETIRCLLDTGSQASYITTHCIQRLKLLYRKSDTRVLGLAQQGVRLRGETEIHLTSRLDSQCSMTVQVLVLDKITGNLPTAPLSANITRKVSNLKLADPDFHIPGPIDCLLGADVFGKCLIEGRLEFGDDLPMAINTYFGWILMGSVGSEVSERTAESFVVTHHAVVEATVEQMLQRFWKIDEPECSDQVPLDDKICEEHFNKTVSRTSDGKYMVRLPFKQTSLKLGSSYHQAETRFLALEKRLSRNLEMYELYRKFMDEYLELNHMEPYEKPDPRSDTFNHYYLPHHGVLKPSSSTTKLRVVYDASCKTMLNSGCSLNDLLFSGPKLQKDITEILVHFRTHRVAMTADIRQMFRCVRVDPRDQNYQLILWRNSADEELKTFRLKSVTFGLTCSPFLAMRSVIQLIHDDGHKYPSASRVLQTDVFVDDIVTGASSPEAALELQRELIELLQSAGFELRKWTCSIPDLLKTLPESCIETPIRFSSPDEPLFTVLGVGWHAESDAFVFPYKRLEYPTTKRGVLSCLAHFYDPLGFITPVTLWAKVFLQTLWTKGLDWDTAFPTDLCNLWQAFVGELEHLGRVTIPQYLWTRTGELHGFCDASERGYAAAVYFVSEDNGERRSTLLIAKSKVAPLKRVCIPRLELCGAHLLSKLLRYTKTLLTQWIEVSQVIAWCDSTVVLGWIQSPSYMLKTFVANRVSDIQDRIPPIYWRHVPSEWNAADCASRGLMPSQLVNHLLWFTGPSFLLEQPECWPKLHIPLEIEHLPERKSDNLNTLTGTAEAKFEFDRFSTWNKLLRTMAYVLRFINNALKHGSKRRGPLYMSEIRIAKMVVLRTVQGEHFHADIQLLQNGKESSSRLGRLTPFLDQAGLLRVGGRLTNSDLSYNAKHPILLPKNHRVTQLIIDHFHEYGGHACPRWVQGNLSQQFWILSARSAIRKQIHQCITCFRHKPTNRKPLMASLPELRVKPARPFLSTSLDFAGPFISRPHRRSTARVKLYLCIFICLSTKAVHLEAVSDLSTAAFMAAFQRFISRRGLCWDVYSDQGTNFQGAASEIKRVFKYFHSSPQRETLAEFATKLQCTWHFQPPAAPHFGGLHEAALRLAKYHIKRILGSQVLTYEEYSTLFARVEAILNSRPLCPLSDDPAEADVLTPGHFLVGSGLLTLPDGGTGLLSSHTRWRLLQDMTSQFWIRWRREYLHTLIQRSKWYESTQNLRIGSMVILQEEGLPPQQWRLARVIELYPGNDGVVRVVRVKTAKGDLTRPSVKIFPLPMN